MKKWIFTLLLLNFSFLIFNSSFAQPVIEWQRCFGGTDQDAATYAQQTADGGYVVVGYTTSINGDVTGNHGGSDLWVVKLDISGNIQWQKCLGGTAGEFANSVQQTADGGYVVAGFSGSNDGDVTGNHGNYDYWVVKLDNSGNIQWQKCLGGTDIDHAYSIQKTSDGGYVIAGWAGSSDGDITGHHGSNDFWVAKLDSSGILLWQSCLGGSFADWAYSIQQTADGGFIIAGASQSNNGDVSGNHGGFSDYWIVKLDGIGNLLWQKCLGGTFSDEARSIQQTLDGGYVFAGFSSSINGDVTGNHGNYDYWVVKLDSSGNLIWQKCLGGTILDKAHSVQQTIDGGYIVAGYSGSNDGDATVNNGGWDYWIVKLDGSGNLLWQKSFGGLGDEWAHFVQQTSDGGYVVAGQSNSNNGDVTGNHGGNDFWVVKLSPFVGIEETNSNPTSTIFPNPFSTTATISFGKQVHGATFTLYNLLGEVVTEISNINGESFQIDRGNIPGGVYFYNVKDLPAGQAGEGKIIARGKVVLL